MSSTKEQPTLSTQFKTCLGNIEIYGPKLTRAANAHAEIREVLASDANLLSLGADPVLIGSYARQTGIYPGKDVDVFVRLRKLTVRANPQQAYDAVLSPLETRYGARITRQPRSIKVDFEPTYPDGRDGFSVDVVPAVPLDDEWALPVPNPEVWTSSGDLWVPTNPTRLTDLASKRNEAPTVGGQGAFKPAVKMVKQIRKHHLADAKPGGLYFELLTYRVFERWSVATTSWAVLLGDVLTGLLTLLEEEHELVNPADDRLYEPAPSQEERTNAIAAIATLRSLAEEALSADRCMAAKLWRDVFGTNDRGEVFPLPEGCDARGHAIAAVSAVSARGSGEAGGFGRS